jgi:hypothetical protein
VYLGAVNFSGFTCRDWVTFVLLIATFVVVALAVTGLTGWPILAVIATVGFVEGIVAAYLLAPAIRRGQAGRTPTR